MVNLLDILEADNSMAYNMKIDPLISALQLIVSNMLNYKNRYHSLNEQ